MRKKTRENLLAGTFLVAILGLLHMQEKRDSMLQNPASRGIVISSKMTSNEQDHIQTITTTYSTSNNQRSSNQISLEKYTVPEEERVITEYSKIVTPEQEELIRKEYMLALQQKEKEEQEKDDETKSDESDEKKKEEEEAKEKEPIELPIHPTNLGRPPLPPVFENIADIVEPVNVQNGDEIPFFWHIPRGGGSTVKDIMGACLDITAASDVGARYGHAEDEALNIIRLNGGKYVNVDATTVEGIERTKRLNAIESGFIEVAVSPRLFAASTLFTPMHNGRMFAMFRDPIERAVSMFYYLGYANWEKTYDPKLLLLELQDYAKTKLIENNWMVRSLTNKMEGYLTIHDLHAAKEVLRRKCLIGLMKEKHVSMKRFEIYFGWEDRAKRPGVEECREKLLSWGWPNKHKHPMLEPGSEAYQLLQTKNALDIELYEYAKVLFVQQGLYLGLPAPTSLSISNLPHQQFQIPYFDQDNTNSLQKNIDEQDDMI